MQQQLFTNNDLRKLIIPLMAERTLAISVVFFDTLMVTSYEEAAVSGVSLVDSVNTLLIQILVALAAGGSVVYSPNISATKRMTIQSLQQHSLCCL